ncbi:hypothetical protein KRR38_07045 [Novosphingobium sp. G106]|uniref:hypothetical protein n=1 Tax=Novosphingobium sp. G106 TaxID=2849500 RepID=UPI001C2D5CE4|nr:hypothetical protein [Novosphingobium sp. G106]MBV1687438.1 hypothetical protein [Novosphingobium sp. G106]
MKNTIKRDNTDFRKSATSPLVRLNDMARTLWEAVKIEADRPLLLPLIGDLAADVRNLGAYRAEATEDMVVMADGSAISLCLMPEVLRFIAVEEGIRGKCWILADDAVRADGRASAIADMMALASGETTSLLRDAARAWLRQECAIAVVD